MTKPLYDFSDQELAAMVEAFKASSLQLAALGEKVPQLYDAEFEQTSEKVQKANLGAASKDLLHGVRERHDQEKSFMARYLDSYKSMIDAFVAQGDFLQANAGKYKLTGQTVEFQDQPSVDTWNALVGKVQATVAAAQQMDKEAEALNNRQGQIFKELQTGE